MVPTLQRLQASELPLSLLPFSLLHVTAGELTLGGDALGARFVAGDLLCLRAPAVIELRTRRSETEALWLHVDPHWPASLRMLFSGNEPPAERAAFVCERASSDIARRVGAILLGTHLETGPAKRFASGALGVETAATMVELLSLADRMNGTELDERPVGARARRRRAPLVRALEALERHDLEGLGLHTLAREIGVSERHASRLVREELGMSFQEYLIGLRLERARKLLATTQRSVTDVALETGWQSISHFNAVFRRRVGVTPSRYRAELSSEEPATNGATSSQTGRIHLAAVEGPKRAGDSIHGMKSTSTAPGIGAWPS